MRILLAEDERSLSRALVKILEKNNYAVDAVFDGEDALAYLRAGTYDAAVLDIMMPCLDGIEVLRALRADGSTLPVMLLTAKAEVEDTVLGLDSGANYYLTKPFDTRELLAGLRAITRGSTGKDACYRMGNVTLDRASFTLSSPAGEFRLANKEFQMMEQFFSQPRTILSAERLLEKIWGFESDVEVSVVWVYISYLRKKLAALGATVRLTAVRNAGYMLEDAHDKEA